MSPLTGLLRTTVSEAAFSVVSMARLVVESGPDAGREYRFGESAVLGRLSSNEVQVSDPQVSRTHTKIVKEADGYHAVDLGSRNGTVVNGIKAQNVLLKSGDRISIGKFVLRFEDTAPGAAFPPPRDAGAQSAAADADAGAASPATALSPSHPRAAALPEKPVAPAPVLTTPALQQAMKELTRPAPSPMPVPTSASQKATAVIPPSKQKQVAGAAASVSDRRRRTLRSTGAGDQEVVALQGWKKWVVIVLCLVLSIGLFFAAKWVGQKLFSDLATQEKPEGG